MYFEICESRAMTNAGVPMLKPQPGDLTLRGTKPITNETFHPKRKTSANNIESVVLRSAVQALASALNMPGKDRWG
jgi:hypothetical protein